jgi:hypothetical protein
MQALDHRYEGQGITAMKKIAIAALLTAALIGCGGKSRPATETPAAATGGATYGGATYGATAADPAVPAADPAATETPANPCAPK